MRTTSYRNRTPRSSKCGAERLKHLSKPETFARCAGCMTDTCLALCGDRYYCNLCLRDQVVDLRREVEALTARAGHTNRSTP